MLGTICLVVALVLFGLAAFVGAVVADGTRVARFNLVAAGLFFLTLDLLIGSGHL